MWRISGYDHIYDNPRLWPRIYKANKSKIRNPDLIYPGQVFNIPPKEGSDSTPKSDQGQKEYSVKERSVEPVESAKDKRTTTIERWVRC